MLSQEKLVKVISEDLRQRTAGRQNAPSAAKQQNIEHMALMRHLEMANDAGEDQTKLEAVVASLEKNPVIGSYQHWRELSEELS